MRWVTTLQVFPRRSTIFSKGTTRVSQLTPPLPPTLSSRAVSSAFNSPRSSFKDGTTLSVVSFTWSYNGVPRSVWAKRGFSIVAPAAAILTNRLLPLALAKHAENPLACWFGLPPALATPDLVFPVVGLRSLLVGSTALVLWAPLPLLGTLVRKCCAPLVVKIHFMSSPDRLAIAQRGHAQL